MTVTNDFAVLMREDLTEYDVMVPVLSCGTKSDQDRDPLLRAVQSGVGIATFHRGYNWFEDERYYRMLGALYLFDRATRTVTIAYKEPQHRERQLPPSNGPPNYLLATADFAGIRTPIVWTRTYVALTTEGALPGWTGTISRRIAAVSLTP